MPADLIPPDMRARLRGLRLATRAPAGGDGLGQHSSRSRGAGLEFAQYRAYEPGDEPRRIDWKLYARSDRYFVRESERDSPLDVWVVLDATASMAQRDRADAPRDKLDAARTIAACLVELALRQGDRFGLVLLGEPLQAVPIGAGARQRDRCLLALAQRRSAGAWPGAAATRSLLERIAPTSLVVLLSDFFDDAAADLATRLALARRELASVQLIASDERDFPFRGSHRFVEQESGAERRVDAAAARNDYIERFGEARRRLAQRFTASGIRHVEHVLDRPADAPLHALFGSSGLGSARAGSQGAADASAVAASDGAESGR